MGRDVGVPKALLYVTKNAMVRRATKHHPNHRKNYLLPGIHAISADQVWIRKKITGAEKKDGPEIGQVGENANVDASDGVDMIPSEFAPIHFSPW